MKFTVTPKEMLDALVRKHRENAMLVREVNGEAEERVVAYYDVYPDNVSLASAMIKLTPPIVMVAWNGSTPARQGESTIWAHQITTYFRPGGDVEEPELSLGRMTMALLDGKIGDTGQPLIYQAHDSWFENMPRRFVEILELFPIQRAQDPQGIDYFECPMVIGAYDI